jgi:hypothetical protein
VSSSFGIYIGLIKTTLSKFPYYIITFIIYSCSFSLSIFTMAYIKYGDIEIDELPYFLAVTVGLWTISGLIPFFYCVHYGKSKIKT